MTTSFNPPIRTLMGPGPADVHPRVLAAMARPTIGHLDPLFIQMMDEMKALLQYAFQTGNALTIPISGPGSAGMETCFVNLIEPGDKVIVCINGVFGTRMKENVERTGGVPVIVEDAWGQPVDPAKVEAALKQNPDTKVLAFVHAETSTGALSDAQALSALAQRHGCLVLVDAVTSLGGSPLKVDEWGIDAIYSGSQKCLSCAPGLSPVSFSERAVARIKARTHKVQSWFLDLNLVMGYWGSGKRAYHHTAPVNALYGLHEALVMLKEEGLERAWARHALHHRALRAGIETMGLSFVVPEAARLPQLNAVTVPAGVDEVRLRSHLLEQFNLEIGAGLGALAGKIVRIGLMGFAANPKNVLFCLDALEAALTAQGAAVGRGAVNAAQQVYANASRTIRADDLRVRLERGEQPMLIDVRRSADYQAAPAGLPGAVWHNPDQLAEWSAQLPPDREIVVYCVRGGAVSHEVVDHLKTKNLRARFIEGGLTAWQQAAQNK